MEIWQIVLYIVGFLFNLAIVASLRAKAYAWGKNWLASGRFAVAAVFVLAFLELLVTGRFEALQNADAFVKLVQDAWLMAGAAVGTHTVAKTAGNALIK